jgi:hypothetical protein
MKVSAVRLFIVSILMCLLSMSTGASPKSDYMIHCMGCHAMDGNGLPPEVPAFDSTLGDIVGKPGGRAYLIQVPGASQSPIDDERLAKVLSWLLHQYVEDDLPQNFRDISTLEVSQFRSVTLKNPALDRARLLSIE